MRKLTIDFARDNDIMPEDAFNRFKNLFDSELDCLTYITHAPDTPYLFDDGRIQFIFIIDVDETITDFKNKIRNSIEREFEPEFISGIDISLR